MNGKGLWYLKILEENNCKESVKGKSYKLYLVLEIL